MCGCASASVLVRCEMCTFSYVGLLDRIASGKGLVDGGEVFANDEEVGSRERVKDEC